MVEPPGLPRRWLGPAFKRPDWPPEGGDHRGKVFGVRASRRQTPRAGSTVGRVDKPVELEFMLSSGLLCVVRSIHLYMRKRREKSIWPSEKK